MIEQNPILNLNRDLTPNKWMKLSGEKYRDYLIILDTEKVSHEFVQQCMRISSLFVKGKKVNDLILNLEPKTDYETHLCAMWRCMMILDYTDQKIIYYSYLQPDKKQTHDLNVKLKKSTFFRRREKSIKKIRENYFLILPR